MLRPLLRWIVGVPSDAEIKRRIEAAIVKDHLDNPSGAPSLQEVAEAVERDAGFRDRMDALSSQYYDKTVERFDEAIQSRLAEFDGQVHPDSIAKLKECFDKLNQSKMSGTSFKRHMKAINERFQLIENTLDSPPPKSKK